MKPLLAIVGRPNVGKSTLLNALAGRRVALTADVPGVTRDPIFAEARTPAGSVLLVDTAGFDPRPQDELGRKVIEQTRQAIADSVLVLLLVDAAEGLHPLDREMALMLKKATKPALCLVNKVDPGSQGRVWEEFFQLGLDCLPVSALHRHGLGRVLQRLGELVSWPEEETASGGRAADYSICLLGRPNSGKSSLANRLLGRERQVVSQTPGTTRDAVDLELERDGVRCLLVDTPGIRRRSRIDQSLERMSVAAALAKLERSDIAALVLDVAEPVADQDARLAHLVQDRGKGLLIVLNKIDLLVDAAARRQALARAQRALRFVSYAPCCLVSALTGEGTEGILPLAAKIRQALSLRLGTGPLNRLLADFVERHPPPQSRGRRPRIYYISQVSTSPPVLVAKVSNPRHFAPDYLRYLENRLRECFDFCGTPILWKLRSSEPTEGRK